MAQASKSNGVVGNVREAVSKNPAAERLVSELESYARNRMLGLVDSIGDRIGDATDRLEDFASNGGPMKKAAKNAAQGDSPLKAGAKAVGSAVKDKLGGLVGGKGDGGNSTKATLIEETIDVGVPVSVAYNQWTQFQEFGRFTKGVQSVTQNDDATTTWKAKVAFSTRSWKAEIKEQIPDEKIAWTSDGDKGSVNGVVTFHELAPNLTRVLLELEYHPKGLFEKTGNLWRAQGRRARLDLKNFRWFVMSEGEETGAWRGEIEDGEVTKSAEQGEQGSRRGRSSQGRSREGTRRRDGSRSERSSSRSPRERRARRSSTDRGERRSRGSARERSSSSSEDTASSAHNRDDERSSRGRRPSARKRSSRRPESSESSESGSGSEAGAGSAEDGAATTSAVKSASPRKRSPAKKTTSRKRTPPRKRTTPRKTSTRTSTSRSTSTPNKTAGTKKSTPRKKSTATKKATPRKRTAARKASATRKSTTAGKTTSPRKRTAAKKTSSARKSAPAGKRTSRRKTTTARKRSAGK